MPNDFISPFRLLFLLALALSLGVRLWLARRQMAHVLAHRRAVPSEFADRIALAAHQKAADYTRARGTLGIYQTLADTALLLVFTLGGGLEALHGFWSSHLVAPGAAPGYAYGIALIFSVTVLSSLVDLPFGLYRQFVLEQRFGFNRMAQRQKQSRLVAWTFLSTKERSAWRKARWPAPPLVAAPEEATPAPSPAAED